MFHLCNQIQWLFVLHMLAEKVAYHFVSNFNTHNCMYVCISTSSCMYFLCTLYAHAYICNYVLNIHIGMHTTIHITSPPSLNAYVHRQTRAYTKIDRHMYREWTDAHTDRHACIHTILKFIITYKTINKLDCK